MARDDRESGPAGDEAADAGWLAAVAGRAVPGEPGSDAALEGAMLRTALRRWSPPVAEVAADDPARADRLVERARAAGLLDSRAADAIPASPRSVADLVRAWWAAGCALGMRPVLAMSLCVIAVAGLVSILRPVGIADDRDVVRGATDGVTVLRAADPVAFRRGLVDALAGQGVVATTYSRFGRFGLDADLPQPVPPAVRAVLQGYRVPLPTDGALRVEVEAEHR